MRAHLPLAGAATGDRDLVELLGVIRSDSEVRAETNSLVEVVGYTLGGGLGWFGPHLAPRLRPSYRPGS